MLFKLLDLPPSPQKKKKNYVQAQPYVLVLLVYFSHSVHGNQQANNSNKPNNVVILYSTTNFVAKKVWQNCQILLQTLVYIACKWRQYLIENFQNKWVSSQSWNPGCFCMQVGILWGMHAINNDSPFCLSWSYECHTRFLLVG